MYVMTAMTLDKELGIHTLNAAISAVTEKILGKGGKVVVQMAPKAVSAREETELQAMMDRLTQENDEASSDHDEGKNTQAGG